jgi:signal peptidase I
VTWGLVQAFVVDVFTVSQQSMLPTLTPGDRVLVARPAVDRPVARGDVVVADVRGTFLPGRAAGGAAAAGPLRWFRPPPSGALVVKRVVAVGGDRIACCDPEGRLLLDGVPLDDPPLAVTGPGGAPFDTVVPPGSVWLVGDNRARSSDSRDHLGAPGGGGVSESALVGRVVSVLRLGSPDGRVR